MNSRSGHVEVGKTALFYEQAGTGKAVVFLHAGVADSRMWDEQFETLASDYTLVRLDLRGFGRTRLAPAEFSDFDAVAAVMDAAGIETATIVGSSYGAQVAIDRKGRGQVPRTG